MDNTKKNVRGVTILEIIISTSLIFLFVSLALPAMQRSRGNARNQKCVNNLKSIGLALHNYHDVHNCIPPGWVTPTPYAQSKSGFGWQTFILPYLEQANIYSQFDFKVPTGKQAFGRTSKNYEKWEIAMYRCPVDQTPKLNEMRGGWGTSNYSGNYGSEPLPRLAAVAGSRYWPGGVSTSRDANGVFFWNSKIRLRDFRDGTSNTFFVGERGIKSAAGIWAGVRANNLETDQVTDCSVGNEINSNLNSYSSLHKGVANFAFADGSVHAINQFIDSVPLSDEEPAGGIFQKLGSRNDGQPVGEF